MTRECVSIQSLERLNKFLIEDILAASDDEILAEAREDGLDPEAVATAMRALFKNVAAQ